MSGYNGRRAPNVSQYIAGLNTVPSPESVHTQDAYGIDEDLSLFTNTEFFDFDLGDQLEETPIEYDPAKADRARRENAQAKRSLNEAANMAFDQNQFQPFDGIPFVPTTESPVDGFPYSQPPQPYPIQYQPTGAPYIHPPVPRGEKRPYSATTQSSSPDAVALEANSRAAAEEDKRRRNTAASARFRVKKKQREQALEKTAKEMTDRADQLESRISQLEMENRWLRNLVTDKTAGKGQEELKKLWESFTAEERSKKGSPTPDGEEIEKADKKEKKEEKAKVTA